jgi:hypothetical protein
MLQPISTTGIQMSMINTKFSTRNVVLAAIYCSPNHKVDSTLFHSILQAAGQSSIIGGDFNAKHTYWASRLINPRGRELLTAIQDLNANILSTRSPTHWPTDLRKKPDVLDFFILRGIPLQKTEVVTLEDLSSDHLPVLLTLYDSATYKPKRCGLTSPKTDWEKYRAIIDESIILRTPLKSRMDLEREVEKFTSLLQTAASASTPPCKRNHDHPTFPLKIRDLIIEKRKARHRWQQTRFPPDKTNYNRLATRLKKELADHRYKSFSAFASGLSPTKSNEKSLWRALKLVSHPRQHDAPLRDLQGKWTNSAEDKARVLAQNLESVFQPNPPIGEPYSPPMNFCHADISLLTSPILVAKEIDKLKTIKAPGYDNISPIMLKQLPKKGIVLLCYLFNAALRLKYVPSQWKRAQIIAIPKPGKPVHDPASYRPISLLPIVGKVFEKIIQSIMEPIIADRGIVPDYQFGFRRKHSTIEQIHHVSKTIRNSLEKKQFCSSAFLDIANAFDKVWHLGLISKLRQSLPANLAVLLESFLENQCFRVTHESELSQWHPIQAGVPQGSVLAPMLYLLYAADAPNQNGETTAMFADDTAILSTANTFTEANNKLQRSLISFNDWTNKWRVKINATKSKHVVFTLNTKYAFFPVQLGNDIIPRHNSAKYLGITLDAKLNWSEHITIKKATVKEKLRNLYWILNRKSPVNLATKRLVYNTVIKPTWTYGLVIWGVASNSNLQKLIRTENKALRTIVGAYRYERNCDIRRDLEIPSLEELIATFTSRYKKRIDSHGNPIAANLYSSRQVIRRLKRKHFNELLVVPM